jgi:hypothetical protein
MKKITVLVLVLGLAVPVQAWHLFPVRKEIVAVKETNYAVTAVACAVTLAASVLSCILIIKTRRTPVKPEESERVRPTLVPGYAADIYSEEDLPENDYRKGWQSTLGAVNARLVKEGLYIYCNISGGACLYAITDTTKITDRRSGVVHNVNDGYTVDPTALADAVSALKVHYNSIGRVPGKLPLSVHVDAE